MRNLHLACLGGCINKQPGIELKAHYHAVFAQKLDGKEPPVAVTVSIGSYLSVDRLVERAGQLLNTRRPRKTRIP